MLFLQMFKPNSIALDNATPKKRFQVMLQL